MLRLANRLDSLPTMHCGFQVACLTARSDGTHSELKLPQGAAHIYKPSYNALEQASAP